MRAESRHRLGTPRTLPRTHRLALQLVGRRLARAGRVICTAEWSTSFALFGSRWLRVACSACRARPAARLLRRRRVSWRKSSRILPDNECAGSRSSQTPKFGQFASQVRFAHAAFSTLLVDPTPMRINWGLSERRVSELASSLTRNQVPGNRLWVRIPCPPLQQVAHGSACLCYASYKRHSQQAFAGSR